MVGCDSDKKKGKLSWKTVDPEKWVDHWPDEADKSWKNALKTKEKSATLMVQLASVITYQRWGPLLISLTEQSRDSM